jgi:hypothetical protein
MSKSNNFVFQALHVVAWIIFIGLSIEAGALLVNFIFSLFKPEVVHNLYEKLDLSQMYSQNQWVYFGMYGFVLTISVFKAFLFYAVIELLSKLDLEKPFNSSASGHITKITYITLFIGIFSYIARQTAMGLTNFGFDTSPLGRFWADSKAFILMAAVLYVIATIFKRGVALQNENDLTV